MLHFIAFKFGFVCGVVVTNGVPKIQSTRDIKEALPFLSFGAADEFMKKNRNGHYYYAVVQPVVEPLAA